MFITLYWLDGDHDFLYYYSLKNTPYLCTYIHTHHVIMYLPWLFNYYKALTSLTKPSLWHPLPTSSGSHHVVHGTLNWSALACYQMVSICVLSYWFCHSLFGISTWTIHSNRLALIALVVLLRSSFRLIPTSNVSTFGDNGCPSLIQSRQFLSGHQPISSEGLRII